MDRVGPQGGEHLAEAAAHFEREGLAFPERNEDIDHAMRLRIADDAWELVRERMQDARIEAGMRPETKYRIAVHDRDWKAAARWLFSSGEAEGFDERLAMVRERLEKLAGQAPGGETPAAKPKTGSLRDDAEDVSGA